MIRTWFEMDDKLFDSHLMAVRLIDLSRNRGGKIEQLLRGTGIFKEDLQKTPHYISFEQLTQLIANIEKHVSSPDLSFLTGRRLFPLKQSSASDLMFNATTLNDIIRIIQVYQRQLFPHFYCQKLTTQEQVFLLINSAVMETPCFQFMYELFCSCVNAVCKWHFGQQIPLHFHFQQKRPKNIYQYEEYLGTRLQFNQPLNMISIDKTWINKPLLDSSPMVRHQSRLEATKLRGHQRQDTGFIQWIMAEIRRSPKTTQEDIASRMDISPATLKRKLKRHGTSFQALQDKCKSQQALFDLKYKGLTNEQTASALEIDNLPNFRRAFKRWTGMTPSQVKLS